MPNMAVMIGRPMASSEPNASSRIKIAARMPIASLAGWVWSVNIEPASSTWRAGVFALLTMPRMCVARLIGTSLACTSKRISAYAILPPLEMKRELAGSYGELTDTTCGCLRSVAITGSIAAFTCGSVTAPAPRTLNTRSPVSPLRAKSRPSVSNARCDSLPGSENVLSRSPPTVCASTLTPTSRMNHAITTRQRCR